MTNQTTSSDKEKLNEALDLLRHAQQEITMLRSRLEQTEPRSEAYGAMLQLLQMMPKPSLGYGIDVAWQIERFLKADAEVQQGKAAEAQA